MAWSALTWPGAHLSSTREAPGQVDAGCGSSRTGSALGAPPPRYLPGPCRIVRIGRRVAVLCDGLAVFKLHLLRCWPGLRANMQSGLTDSDMERISEFVSTSKYRRTPEMLVPEDE